MATAFVSRLAETLATTKKHAGELLESFVTSFGRALDEDRAFAIPGLGRFAVQERRARSGRNPQTGAVIEIAALKLVTFAAESRSSGDGASLTPHLADDLGSADAREVIDAVASAITAALEADGKVTVPGLGKLSSRERRARSGRNPTTGEVIRIPASRSITFAPDERLVARLHFASVVPRRRRPAPAPRTWKPVSELEPEDFKKHPLWGYDLGRGESEADADESFVRPYTAVDKQADFSTTYFARVKVRLADRTTCSGTLVFHIEFGEVVPEALEVDRKRRVLVPMGMAARAPYVKKQLARVRKLFPLRYQARLATEAGPPLVIDAEVDPSREVEPAPDAFDLSVGLGPLPWSDSGKEAIRRFPEGSIFEHRRWSGSAPAMRELSIESFLDVDGVTLGARIWLFGDRVVNVGLAPRVRREDLSATQRTLARRLGCPDAPRIPGMQQWSSGGCEVELVSRGARDFFVGVRPPERPRPRRTKRPRKRA